ncbi:MAG: hypothetical protein L6Q71_05095 [Planctomycetes bacterium]|nr:hypothetical protein [Planctomycetota bacterium]NUQ33512.1 hypothetical protein [Planctomycetaceae bacterium]
MAKRTTLSEAAKEDLRREIEYFRKNRLRMRYASLHARGYPIGSGLIEGLCRSVFQERFKESGMTWTTRGLRAIAAFVTQRSQSAGASPSPHASPLNRQPVTAPHRDQAH